MRRLTRTAVAALIVLSTLMFPRPAEAGVRSFWDWLEELSGPGKWRGLMLDVKLYCWNSEDTGGGGGLVVGCYDGGDSDRSFRIGFRMVEFQDTSGDAVKWAGGNRMRLTTVVPSLDWRVLKGRANFLGAGAGIGMYWITSSNEFPGDFETISGVVLEPIRLTLNVPPDWFKIREAGPDNDAFYPWNSVRGALRLLSVIEVRAGVTVFPAGFPPNAFGPGGGKVAARLPAELTPYYGVFADFSTLVRLFNRR